MRSLWLHVVLVLSPFVLAVRMERLTMRRAGDVAEPRPAGPGGRSRRRERARGPLQPRPPADAPPSRPESGPGRRSPPGDPRPGAREDPPGRGAGAREARRLHPQHGAQPVHRRPAQGGALPFARRGREEEGARPASALADRGPAPLDRVLADGGGAAGAAAPRRAPLRPRPPAPPPLLSLRRRARRRSAPIWRSSRSASIRSCSAPASGCGSSGNGRRSGSGSSRGRRELSAGSAAIAPR